MMQNSLSLNVRVARKWPVAEGVSCFELESETGEALPAFSAGAHIDVAVPGGLTRQYSLCSDPVRRSCYEIAVLKDDSGRGGSKAMHEAVQEGDFLQISPPKNHFPLAPGAHDTLLLAGGIGITPLLCMAGRLSALHASFQLHYCTRSREKTAFRERIEQAPYSQQVHFHTDDLPESKLDLAALLAGCRAGTHLYTCGPQGFMDWVLDSARQAGWGDDRLHYEFFNARPAKLVTDGLFEVQIASSGLVIPVAPHESIVDAIQARGVQVQVSCLQGVCGTCLTRVLEGEVDHRDMYLTEAERAANDQMLVCCSRARSDRIVLDL